MKAHIREGIVNFMKSVHEEVVPQFLNNQAQAPTLFLLKTGGGWEVVDFSPYIDDKDLMAIMLKAYQMDDRLDGTLLLTEAWMMAIDAESEEGKRIERGEDPSVMPSDSPARKEVLFYMAETRFGSIAAEAAIVREGTKAIEVTALHVMPDVEEDLRGRFIGGQFS